MTQRSRLIILSLALIGIGVAGWSTWVHHKLLTDPSYVSPCDINSAFNCSQVYLSKYGSVANVPVAVGGVIWFALVALVAAYSRPAGAGETPGPGGSYIFALSTIGLASVLSLAYASFFVLKVGCPLCIATYVCVAGIFIASGLSTSVPVLSLPGRLVSDLRNAMKKPSILAAIALFVVGTVALIAYFPADAKPSSTLADAAPPKLPGVTPAANTTTPGATPGKQDDPKAQFEAWWNSQPRVETGVPLAGAKVVIVKFSDFECPGCKQTWLMYTPIIKKYRETAPTTVRYVMKDFALNNKCNVMVTFEKHPMACDAAAANRMAEDKGKGDEMEAWLFNNQGTLTAASVRQAAKTIAGIDDFDRQYSLKLARLKQDSADGGALKVGVTPTFYINGVLLPESSWLHPDYFDLAIQIELKKAGALPPK
jgi:uncharacterized membrane protein/protein-disulfide isomerase